MVSIIVTGKTYYKYIYFKKDDAFNIFRLCSLDCTSEKETIHTLGRFFLRIWMIHSNDFKINVVYFADFVIKR